MRGIGGFDPSGELANSIVAVVRRGDSYDCDGAEISADWLRRLIIGSVEPQVHAKGIRIINATIDGRLDLEAISITHGVHLNRCHFSEAPCVVDARLRELHVSGSTLPGLEATAVTLVGHLRLDEATVTGPIDIGRASIGGQFSANGASLDGAGQTALNAQGAKIGGGIFLNKAIVTGQVV